MTLNLERHHTSVCGIANLSPRSLLATSIFMAAAVAAVFITRHGAFFWNS